MAEAPGALAGLRVIDLTTGSFGYSGRLLAGLGADVIKVEAPDGDPVRGWPPFAGDEPHPERSARHLHLNAGKRSITLDLDVDEGRSLLRRLVRECDVLVENFEPGYLGSRGLAYDDLVVERPDLVMVSITHFGQDGPYAHYRGAEIVSAALGGYLKLTGDPDREPVKPYDDLVVQHAALHAAMAVMTGLTHRDATGEGDHFDVAVIDASLFLMGGPVQTHHASGQVAVRNGARLLRRDPTSLYPSTIRPCKDGYVHAHLNYRYPDLMAVLMQDPAIDELLDTPMANADAIDERMDRWLAKYDKFEVVRLAQELRVPFTEVLTPDELLRDEHLEQRGFFVEVEHPVVGTVRQPAGAALMTATPWRTRRAPLLGEHTDDVLSEVIGLDAGEIDGLRAAGAI
jgi:crotonobetainyl-CoA:carnitine CoA-transferase CaiB-like acyl-CoA transferase